MKFIRASGTLGLAVAAAIASPFAVADDTGWYLGANVGQSKAKIDDVRIISALQGAGLATTSLSDDASDIGYKLFGGYQLNKYFALESGYFDLGKFAFTANTIPTGTLNGDIKLRGFNFDAVGIFPLTEKIALFGRVGGNYAETKDTFSGTGAVRVLNPNPSKRQSNYKFGGGLQYAFNESWAMRAEVERYRINDAVGNKGDVDLISLGVIYRFAKKKAPPPAPWVPVPVAVAAPVPQPEPIVVPPPPPPPPAAAPVLVRLAQVAFSADSLFDFDKSTVKPAGRQHLDKFAADMKGTNFAVITVTGHTDRLGSVAYNNKLATRRAEAVKTYLVQSAGIPADKVRTREVDESEPVTKPGQCVGKKATKALIACLAPDRRVEVEVHGTK